MSQNQNQNRACSASRGGTRSVLVLGFHTVLEETVLSRTASEPGVRTGPEPATLTPPNDIVKFVADIQRHEQTGRKRDTTWAEGESKVQKQRAKNTMGYNYASTSSFHS